MKIKALKFKISALNITCYMVLCDLLSQRLYCTYIKSISVLATANSSLVLKLNIYNYVIFF